jgi:hypothetical protein
MTDGMSTGAGPAEDIDDAALAAAASDAAVTSPPDADVTDAGSADLDDLDSAAAAEGGSEQATLEEPVVPPESWCIVAVAGVTLDLPNAHPEVVLHEAQHPWRELNIPVGMAEGTAIAYAFRGLDTPRPLTHTLMSEILERHNVSVEAVRITVRRGHSFFAEIDTTGPNGRQVIPCRPSDAIALALRQRLPTPILVAEWVFTAGGPDSSGAAEIA